MGEHPGATPLEVAEAEHGRLVAQAGGTLHPFAKGVWFDRHGIKRYGDPDSEQGEPT